MYDYAPTVLAFAAAARLALHNGNVDELDRQLTRAMRARPSCTYVFPFLAARGRLQLAKVYLARSDHAEPQARHLLREIDDVFGHRPDLGTLVDEVRRLPWARRCGCGGRGHRRPAPDPAELRLLPYLQTHLTIGEIGERLFVSRNTVSSEVASIYRKLGVSSRNDAVEQATAVGLLGG